jgi:hypothetical protein
MTNKTAGLYVRLVGALNALEEAGEDPRGEIEGEEAIVCFDPETRRWSIA